MFTFGFIAMLCTSCFILQPTTPRPTSAVVATTSPQYNGSNYNSGYGNTATISTPNYDISFDLDLTAVLNVFSQMRNLESFERTLT